MRRDIPLQLGPSGQISTINVSPYDGSAFARNTWSLGLEALATEEFANLLPRDAIERLELGPHNGTRIEPRRSQRTVHDALENTRRLDQLLLRRLVAPVSKNFDLLAASETVASETAEEVAVR